MKTEKSINTSKKFQSLVKGLLHDETIENLCITFTKSDGTERDLFCTLSEEKIPTEKAPKGTGRKTSTEVQNAFDTKKQEWRSFRWDSVKSIRFDLG